MTERSRFEHAAPRCDRTDDGEGRGEAAEADQRGCFEFYVATSPQLITVWAVQTGVHLPAAAQEEKSCEVKPRMNLYRSFGNLMEAWVSEGSQCLNDDDPPTPSSDTGNLRSESVDSGVETASSDASFPAISCSTDNTEIEIFTPEREDDSPTPASTSLSPVLSSPASSLSSYSSVRLCPSRAQEGSSILRQKVEQAILRTESKHLKEKPEPLTVDVVLRRRPRASFQPKQQTSGLVRGQRSESFGSRRTVDPLVHTRQICRRPMSMSCVKPAVQRRLEVRLCHKPTCVRMSKNLCLTSV